MNNLEDLAVDLMWLSNKSLQEVATLLVKDAPTRADALVNMLVLALQERDRLEMWSVPECYEN